MIVNKKCKCSVNIIFATVHKPDGSSVVIPLDADKQVYRVSEDIDSSSVTAVLLRGTNTERYLVNHFQTCPQANKFSGGRSR